MIVETVFMTMVLGGLLLAAAGCIGYWYGHARGKTEGLESTATLHLTKVTQSMLEVDRQAQRREAFMGVDPTITREDPPVSTVIDQPPPKPQAPERQYTSVPDKQRGAGSFPIGGNYVDSDFASFDVPRASMG